MNQALIAKEDQQFVRLKQISCILDETSIICNMLTQLQCEIIINEIVIWA